MSYKFGKLPFIDKKGQECLIEEIGLSDLGYVMLRLYYPKKGVWVSHVIDDWDPKDNFITHQMDFHEKIKKLKKLR
jgi:hypothetical protein